MVSIKKIFGSSSGDHSGQDGGDLRHASTGSQGMSSGHEQEAKTKNDELARHLKNNNDSTNNNESLGHRKSLSGANNSTGLTSNTDRSSNTTTGYNTEATGLPKTMGAYNGPPGVGPSSGLASGVETHATNEHAKGIHNKGLDNIGSHRGLVGGNTEKDNGLSTDGTRPVVQVLSQESVPGTGKGAMDHILHTQEGVTRDNDIGTQRNTTSAAPLAAVPAAAAVHSEKSGHGRLSSSSSGRGFEQPHQSGHIASKEHHEFDPKLATHDHQHLQHVTHREVRHVEVEEVERQREVDRHIHHVQTHVQPVLDKKILPEKIHENLIAPTKVHEVHSSTPEDVQLFTQLATQHRDTESHRAKERTVVDLGEKVNEKVIHHVHHVTQPVIEQEIVERHRIHTVIPVHHVTHEAPIIHKSSTHAPVSLDDFLSGGGKLDSKITHQTSGLLDDADCAREINGPAPELLEKLNLKGGLGEHHHSHSRENSLSGSTSGQKQGHVSNDGDVHKTSIAAKVDNMTPSNDRIGSTQKI